MGEDLGEKRRAELAEMKNLNRKEKRDEIKGLKDEVKELEEKITKLKVEIEKKNDALQAGEKRCYWRFGVEKALVLRGSCCL